MPDAAMRTAAAVHKPTLNRVQSLELRKHTEGSTELFRGVDVRESTFVNLNRKLPTHADV
jgi:hypothetical protein